MKDDFYLFLSSNESSAAYGNNTFTDFIVECPKLYELEANHDSYWQVALTDLIAFGVDSLSANTKVVCILCDLVTQSHITATQKPVLLTYGKLTQLRTLAFSIFDAKTDEKPDDSLRRNSSAISVTTRACSASI